MVFFRRVPDKRLILGYTDAGTNLLQNLAVGVQFPCSTPAGQMVHYTEIYIKMCASLYINQAYNAV